MYVFTQWSVVGTKPSHLLHVDNGVFGTKTIASGHLHGLDWQLRPPASFSSRCLSLAVPPSLRLSPSASVGCRNPSEPASPPFLPCCCPRFLLLPLHKQSWSHVRVLHGPEGCAVVSLNISKLVAIRPAGAALLQGSAGNYHIMAWLLASPRSQVLLLQYNTIHSMGLKPTPGTSPATRTESWGIL